MRNVFDNSQSIVLDGVDVLMFTSFGGGVAGAVESTAGLIVVPTEEGSSAGLSAGWFIPFDEHIHVTVRCQ